MSNNLTALTNPQNHKNLLWTELAAWLHNWEKCTKRHITSRYITRNVRGVQTNVSQRNALVVPSLEITLVNGRPITLRRLVKGEKKTHWLEKVLTACHRAAHTEKEEVFLQFKQEVKQRL